MNSPPRVASTSTNATVPSSTSASQMGNNGPHKRTKRIRQTNLRKLHFVPDNLQELTTAKIDEEMTRLELHRRETTASHFGKQVLAANSRKTYEKHRRCKFDFVITCMQPDAKLNYVVSLFI
jgi:hypothetical protein